ncbi:unnamed protein product [Bursaphelenchus xylophilus]|uniref:glucuronosyltransferase n=1 Tax=Bursaphelenchus xylophilus TaxID=6326 RepID=A0A7I8XLI0_BURXY|nr:unnamed protein product [Bursaphelenchus xylophilus]CAG9086565.1 unnamed protein product [Bursaphelenchus xylophilus]
MLPFAHAITLGLVASSGCYSHDKTLSSLVTDDEWNVTWIQVKVFDFGKTVELPDNWVKFIFSSNQLSARHKNQSVSNQNESSQDSLVDLRKNDNQLLHSYGGPLVWSGNVPFEPERPTDFRGMVLFYNIIMSHRKHCLQFMKSEQYKLLKESKFDVLVIDHFVQGCLTILSSSLSPSVIQYSNWPVSDGYLTSMNVPSYPSYVPTTGTTFSHLKMNFSERLKNTIAFVFIQFVRLFQSIIVWIDFRNSDFTAGLFDHEGSHLLYTVRSEFLLEPVRPWNNRIKHFGCSTCSKSDIHTTNDTELPRALYRSLSKKFILVTFGSLSNKYVIMSSFFP